MFLVVEEACNAIRVGDETPGVEPRRKGHMRKVLEHRMAAELGNNAALQVGGIRLESDLERGGIRVKPGHRKRAGRVGRQIEDHVDSSVLSHSSGEGKTHRLWWATKI